MKDAFHPIAICIDLSIIRSVFGAGAARRDHRLRAKLSGSVREIRKCAKDLAIGCNERGAEILRQTDELAVIGRAAGRHSEVQHVMRDDAIFTACHPAFSLVDHSSAVSNVIMSWRTNPSIVFRNSERHRRGSRPCQRSILPDGTKSTIRSTKTAGVGGTGSIPHGIRCLRVWRRKRETSLKGCGSIRHPFRRGSTGTRGEEKHFAGQWKPHS